MGVKKSNSQKKEKKYLWGEIHKISTGIRLFKQRSITQGNAFKTKAISSAEEKRPKERRTSEFAPFSFTPIAFTTCEGFTEPLEQADPLEAQMPSKSRAPSKAMLSVPSTIKETVLKRRKEGSRSPRKEEASQASNPEIRRTAK